MLGLILIYWIGKKFYKLAEKYEKSAWGYAILGIVVYYGGIVLLSMLIGVLLEIFSPGYVNEINETLFGFLMIPFGLLSCYLLYKYLEKKWKKIFDSEKNQIDLIGKKEE